MQRSPISHITSQQPCIDDTYDQNVEQPHKLSFHSHNNHLLAHDEPPSWMPQPFHFLSIQSPMPQFLHYNLRPYLFLLTQFSSNSPCMDSDDSNQTVFNAISKFIKSEVETPDEILDSEPSPTDFSQPPLQLIIPTTTSVEFSLLPSSHTGAIPIFSSLSSKAPDATSQITDDQVEHNLDEFVIHLQQIHNTNNSLTIHQLNHSASISESSIVSVHIAPTRAHRVFMKRKHPYANTQFLISSPQTSRLHSQQPHHKNTPEFLLHNLAFSPTNLLQRDRSPTITICI